MNINRREVLKGVGAGAAVLLGGSVLFPERAFAGGPAATEGTSDVSFVGSGPSGTRRQMIADVLDPWRATLAEGIVGKTILVKANVVGLGSGRTTAQQILPLTHVDALRGLLDVLRSISPSTPIIIGDCSAAPNISNAWAKAGYTALPSEYPGVTLMDLGDSAAMPTVNQTIWRPDLSETTSIPIISAFLDPAYYVISICRPKTHDVVVMTATTKNIIMAAPPRSARADGKTVNPKSLMHGRGSAKTLPEEAKCLSYNIFQLGNVIYPVGTPNLSVLDAWEGMEGNGPADGRPIMQYCAVAGTDSLAVDRISATLMGFSDEATEPADPENPSYTDMRYLTWMSSAGFGNYDLDAITFVQGCLDDVRSYSKVYTLHSRYTSEIDWDGGPPDVLPPSGGRLAHLDPRPFLVPQPAGPVGPEDVRITFALPVETPVSLGLFTSGGVEVRRLVGQTLAPGRYSAQWDGRDRSGARVPTGAYTVRLGFGGPTRGGAERAVEDQLQIS